MSSREPSAENFGSHATELLDHLPLLLNSILSLPQVLTVALQQISKLIPCEASTVFLIDEQHRRLSGWELKGKRVAKVQGLETEINKGLAGHVMEQGQSVLANDVRSDPSFPSDADLRSSLQARDVLCIPLTVQGGNTVGAIRFVNSTQPGGFSDEMLQFAERCSAHIALAVRNAQLMDRLTSKSRLLKKLEQYRASLLTTINHEFRTPLNIIQNCAQLLATSEIASAEHRALWVSTLQRGIARLEASLKQVARLSMLERKEIVPVLEKTDLSPLITTICNQYAEVLKQRRLSLTLRGFDASLIAIGDPGLLSVVVANLITNAIRFTPDGGTISVSGHAESGRVAISVADSGIGIAEDQQLAIFKKFHEVINVEHHSSGDLAFQSSGLGLGLPTALAITELHGGSISLVSSVGKGSTFTLNLTASPYQR